MNLLVAVVVGAGVGVGVLLVLLGLQRHEPSDDRRRPPWHRLERIDQLNLRLGLAVAFTVVAWFLTAWPVALALAFVGGFVTPTLVGAKKRRREAVTRTEAVAGWAEQLRDIIASAAGLNEAIAATSAVAPLPIRTDVQNLARRLRYQPLPDLLRQFAADVDDPAADQIAAALTVASERRAQNLTELLSEVATAAREEASMRMRTETARAQTYSDVRAVTFIVLAVFLFLLLTNRGYLEPFGSLTGQLVLALVGLMWAGAIQGLAALAVVRRPTRVLAINEGDRS
jgi:Flp pilus assembly protein TadB